MPPLELETATFVRRNPDHDNNLTAHFLESVLCQRRAGQFLNAVATAFACLRLHLLDPHYYKPLLYALLPLRLVDSYRLERERAPLFSCEQKGAIQRLLSGGRAIIRAAMSVASNRHQYNDAGRTSSSATSRV